ncbi:T7SS effector LXG polymorphic toxin [Fictibacillus phosphorivorans]|uniref:T7SS effector LXG polymorphic toxin n=1 Tax=Fictibacillus phosphorivorans TaxID=1221500 RepID=UPI001D1743E3|nr:T7SS effector LXG polymorphic toxin [Fictibacillus phosphorivorans]
MGSKVYEAPTLKAATKERAQHYEELREQFVGLKKEFGKIVDDGQFQGHGAEAIKGFYQAQSDIVDAWIRFIDVNIEFFKSIPGYAEDANLADNSMVQVPFLEENVSQGLKSAKDRVADQQESLQNIFSGINDLVSLTVFSKDPFDEQMDQAEKKRIRTVEAVNAMDQQLTQEYLGLQNLVEQVNELYSAMINATRQGENISPLYFNAEAYKTSSVFQMQSELKTQAAGYVEQKRSERMPSAMKHLSQEAKVYTLKKEKGFFTEIWDNVQSGSGSALDDTVDGLVNMVKNPGETFDGLKYAAAHPIKTGSAAWDQLSTSFNEEVIHGDAGSRAHYFSYMGTQLGVSVLGGKGIDKLSKVSKVDLAKSMGKVKKHTYVVNKKSTAYLEKFNLLFAKERLAADGLTIDLKDFDNIEEEMMVLQASKVREVEGKVNPPKISEIQEGDLGKHIIKVKNGRKELAPNVRYITKDGYKYTTDELGRIVDVEAGELILQKGKRNKGMQVAAGREDRLPDDDGGHLIGTQFHGSGDIDNLIAQNRQINRSGGEWYNMEQEWANALGGNPPKKVTVKIEPVYQGTSLRPSYFEIVYEIEGKGIFEKTIRNRAGG